MTYKIDLGFSPLTKSIYIGHMKDKDGFKECHPTKEKVDVTNIAAQFTWMLVLGEGGQIEWNHPEGGKMILHAELVK